jgi:ParB family chromosome partitioning protein
MTLGKGLNSLITPGSGEHNNAPAPLSLHHEEIRVPFPRKESQGEHHSYPTPQPSRQTRPDSHQRQESIFHIEVEKIVPNPYQPRKIFNEEEIQELADSIKEFGVLQPISVSKVVKETSSGTRVEYQLVAGERRLKAAKRAGLPRIPAIIRKGDTPKMKLELALIENIQRSNLNPLESARGYARLQDEFDLTQKDIALRVGKSRETVANTMRLLNLPSHIQMALEEGKINESQARTLISVESPHEQEMIFERMLSGTLTARKARERTQKTPVPDPERVYWQKRLEERTGLPVEIEKKGTRGKVSLQFYSDEEFQNILRILGETPEL